MDWVFVGCLEQTLYSEQQQQQQQQKEPAGAAIADIVEAAAAAGQVELLLKPVSRTRLFRELFG